MFYKEAGHASYVLSKADKEKPTFGRAGSPQALVCILGREYTGVRVDLTAGPSAGQPLKQMQASSS
jgi:hypothetical protein